MDQVRITVIATGFDETRARLAQISQPKSEIPVIQGVVSEKPSEVSAEDEEDKDDEEERPPMEPPEEEEDMFGEKFEIPAFLRKIH